VPIRKRTNPTKREKKGTDGGRTNEGRIVSSEEYVALNG